MTFTVNTKFFKDLLHRFNYFIGEYLNVQRTSYCEIYFELHCGLIYAKKIIPKVKRNDICRYDILSGLDQFIDQCQLSDLHLADHRLDLSSGRAVLQPLKSDIPILHSDVKKISFQKQELIVKIKKKPFNANEKITLHRAN